MSLTLPPLSCYPIIESGDRWHVDRKTVRFVQQASEKKVQLALIEGLSQRSEGHIALWKALDRATKARFQQLLPFASLEDEGARWYPIFNNHIKLPGLIGFDRVCFWVESAVRRAKGFFEFTLTHHPHLSLIKTGHEWDRSLRPLPASLLQALRHHFDLEGFEKQQPLTQDEKTLNLLAQKKSHHYEVMSQWRIKALWSKLGAPIAMPLWTSSWGGWQIYPKTRSPANFCDERVAACLNQILFVESLVGIPLLEGSWAKVKKKLVVHEGKVYLTGKMAPFQLALCDRQLLLAEIQREEPELFKKLNLPNSHVRDGFIDYYRSLDKVPRLRTLLFIRLLSQGKEVPHPFLPSSHLFLNQLFALSCLHAVGALSTQQAEELLWRFSISALQEYSQECRLKWINAREAASAGSSASKAGSEIGSLDRAVALAARHLIGLTAP